MIIWVFFCYWIILHYQYSCIFKNNTVLDGLSHVKKNVRFTLHLEKELQYFDNAEHDRRFDSNRGDWGSISPKTSLGSPPFWSKVFNMIATTPLFPGVADPLTDSSDQPQTRTGRESKQEPREKESLYHTPIPHRIVGNEARMFP